MVIQGRGSKTSAHGWSHFRTMRAYRIKSFGIPLEFRKTGSNGRVIYYTDGQLNDTFKFVSQNTNIMGR